MDLYFQNISLLENTLLPYFCDDIILKCINKVFSGLNYEKYNTHLQFHGSLETYYIETKTIEERNTYRNGELELYERWHDNGPFHIKCNYKNNKMNGLYIEWHSNSKLYRKTNYKNGERDGLCERWTSNGLLVQRNNYKNGELDNSYINKYYNINLERSHNCYKDSLGRIMIDL
jgi:antitoxin component YwqK of YwqJK toxin-antitoxin module